MNRTSHAILCLVSLGLGACVVDAQPDEQVVSAQDGLATCEYDVRARAYVGTSGAIKAGALYENYTGLDAKIQTKIYERSDPNDAWTLMKEWNGLMESGVVDYGGGPEFYEGGAYHVTDISDYVGGLLIHAMVRDPCDGSLVDDLSYVTCTYGKCRTWY